MCNFLLYYLVKIILNATGDFEGRIHFLFNNLLIIFFYILNSFSLEAYKGETGNLVLFSSLIIWSTPGR